MRPPSALAEIGGFGLAVASVSIVATAGVILTAPEPSPRAMSIAGAATALKGSPVEGLVLERGPEPTGARALFIEATLASTLKVRMDSVRAVWLGRTASIGALPEGAAALPRALAATARRSGEGAPPSVVVVARSGAVAGVLTPGGPSTALSRHIAAMPQPAFAAAVRRNDGGWLIVRPRQAFWSGWRLRLIAVLAACLLLLAPLTWLIARRLTRPLRELADSVRENRSTPARKGPRELRAASAAISEMRERLAREAAERTRMLAAVAHDLRTPLTGLRLRAESAPSPARERMVADIARMQAMIAEVLEFSRAATCPPGPVRVRAALEEVVNEAQADGTEVILRDGPDALVEVDSAGFRRALENLIRNAAEYAGGGQVGVEVRSDSVVVTVSDRGPGIPAEDRTRLLLPFERGEDSRNRSTGGAGLGLSIVSHFADRHGGSFALGEARGGGTTAELSLPRTSAHISSVRDAGDAPSAAGAPS